MSPTYCALWVLVCFALSTAGCRRGEAYERPIQPVRVQVVGPSGQAGAIRYSGRVAAVTEVTVEFRVGGYVTSITSTQRADGTRRLLQAGDPVRRTSLLASLRRSDYATRSDELRGMRAGLHASVIKAKLDLDRAQVLLQQRVMAQAEYDAVKARYDELVGDELAAAARVGQANIALADTELRSPLDGVVVQRSVEVGDLAAPGTPAFVVADTHDVKVIFGVPDSVRKALRVDDAVTIRTEGVPGRTFRGVVSKIAEKADERSRAFDVEATIANADLALKIGFIATVEVESAGAVARAPAVPLSAIVPSPAPKDAHAVYVVTSRDGQTVASLRPVVLGHLVRNDVTISEGVAEGDRVIVVGAEHVHDGERVAIVP